MEDSDPSKLKPRRERRAYKSSLRCPVNLSAYTCSSTCISFIFGVLRSLLTKQLRSRARCTVLHSCLGRSLLWQLLSRCLVSLRFSWSRIVLPGSVELDPALVCSTPSLIVSCRLFRLSSFSYMHSLLAASEQRCKYKISLTVG